MRDLQRIAQECINELDQINIPYGNVEKFVSNQRFSRTWGRCQKTSGGFLIQISEKLLQDHVPMEALKQTILHEMIHTCPGCFNHQREWKRMAALVNNTYGYNIKTYSDAEELGMSPVVRKVKHRFVCTGCGLVIERQKESKFTKNYKKYYCSRCKGRFQKEF